MAKVAGGGAGAKTELVTIERSERTPDGGGGFARTWTVLGQLWAEAQWVRGGEDNKRGAVRETSVYRFTVLTDEAEALGIRADDRIIWNTDPYNIRERPRRLQRAIETEIVAEMGVAQ